ncbi:Crp/Fnr family transcriptional regulator [Streptomyces sp. NPDC001852]|uniref:Crp/Fnr family transcriptional regulator n=1 Tax=Streptomyces sp. NPDC001852 TaxID=3364619 RepID=UPI0036921E2C
MANHKDDDFEALLERSSLGSPAARRLRERTPLSRSGTVRRIIKLRNRIAHHGDDLDGARQSARELVQLLDDMGFRTESEVPDELLSAARLAESMLAPDVPDDLPGTDRPVLPQPTPARPSPDLRTVLPVADAEDMPELLESPAFVLTGSDNQTSQAHEQSSQQWPSRSLLGTLTPPARQELLGLGTQVRFDAGDVLLREGATDRHSLLLVSGIAKVTARAESGDPLLIAFTAAGDTVGEMAALDGAPRSATVTACGPMTARALHPGVLRELLMRRPEVAAALTAMASNRLRFANQQRLNFLSYPAKVRLARLLVDLAASYGSPTHSGVVIRLRLTQSELATMVGTAEPAIHKALRELRNERLLETSYRSTVLPDLHRLTELAELAAE